MTETPQSTDFWSAIFNSFRPEDHKFLVVSTSNGLEVAVQDISRVEEGLVLIRGRISGTADSGRLFLLPYHQLSSVYVNRPVRREEVELFSPTVEPGRKLEVARQVADLERRARDEARSAEAAKNGDYDLSDTMKKLDTLRDQPVTGERPTAQLDHTPPNTSARGPSFKPKVGRIPMLANRAAKMEGSSGESKKEE
jgi:hypothetical protein